MKKKRILILNFGALSDVVTMSLAEGIARTEVWVKSCGSAKPAEFKNIEIYENLPPSWR